MGVPIYIFTGFLESGKTTLIKDMLLDPGFTSDEKTLLLVCEEGMEEYDDAFLKKVNTSIVTVEKESDLTYPFLKKCDSMIEPDRILIEFNGTWNLTNFFQTELPYDWMVVQVISTVDASTFELYINNMRSMLYETLVHSETIIFNRCDETTKKLYLRNNIKAINKSAQLIYEAKDGSINSLTEDELPFDIESDEILIADDDYGIWYMDALEHPNKYKGKTIELSGSVISNEIEGIANAFVLGRYAMVCCADDTSLIGLLCHYKKASQLVAKTWVTLRAVVEVEYDEVYQGDIPVLFVSHIEEREALEDELVYFT